MRRTSSISWLLTVLALSALGLGLLSLPDDFSRPIRLVARDVSGPGQTVTGICVGWGRSGWLAFREWQARRGDLEILKQQLAAAKQQNIQYQQQLTNSRQQLQQVTLQAKVAASQSSEPLFRAELVEARVLGEETVALAEGRKLLDVGTAQGVGEKLLVVEPGRATLDVGADLGLTIHQPVFSGEIVVGRTAMCGAYTSSLQSVSDAKFQAPVQIMRKTEAGLQPGPEGILEGTGKNLCRLTGVWHSEAVEVGDEVYTPASDPLLPHPMFYGRVVRAEPKEGMPYWEVDVEPAAKSLRLTFVRVLKPTENRARIAAN